jgi:Asp-tRNA(Asn)/Glu-tRNA(Gln) amidotransferase A subunit family amidase
MREVPLPALETEPVHKLRLAVNTANLPMVSAEQRAFVEQVLSELRKQGAEVGEILQEYAAEQRTIMQWEFKPHLESYLRTASSERKTLAEIVAFYEANPERMKYGITLLKQALLETPGGLEAETYLKAMAVRDAKRKEAAKLLAPYDAVIMTGPTNIMHFCGMPSVCIAGKQKNSHGFPRCLILYGTDEQRLYRAALAIEALLP